MSHGSGRGRAARAGRRRRVATARADDVRQVGRELDPARSCGLSHMAYGGCAPRKRGGSCRPATPLTPQIGQGGGPFKAAPRDFEPASSIRWRGSRAPRARHRPRATRTPRRRREAGSPRHRPKRRERLRLAVAREHFRVETRAAGTPARRSPCVRCTASAFARSRSLVAYSAWIFGTSPFSSAPLATFAKHSPSNRVISGWIRKSTPALVTGLDGLGRTPLRNAV